MGISEKIIVLLILVVFPLCQCEIQEDDELNSPTYKDDNENEELYKQDPHGSGVHQCRKCTLEYSKLDKVEQSIWTKYKDMHHTEFQKRFKLLGTAIGLTEINPVEVDRVKKNDLYPEEVNLLTWYETELKLSVDEQNEKLLKLTWTVTSIKAWQEYEKHILNTDNAEEPVKVNKLSAKLEEDLNFTKTFQRIEL